MKRYTFLIALISLIIFSCSYPKQEKVVSHIPDHFKPGNYCYKALFEKDSASLFFTITADHEIKGQLNVNYHDTSAASPGHQPTAGNFTGTFRGDTLYADYYFTSGANKDARYVNPIALLLKGDTLIMGHGRIYYYLGRTYFDDKTPIDYIKSRFRFVPAGCK
jgi:hypothetical protein